MNTPSAAQGVTRAQLREATRGFTLMLRRKRFSPDWIEANASDLLAQANKEYAEKLAKGERAQNPVGWLIVCAWRRAQNLLDSQSRKPRTSSLESVFHLADESTPTPEQQVLDGDLQERLWTAMRHLPEKERRLLSLVYFESYSIREAGRKVGWQKSAADRHHGAALEKLHALVGDDRSLLSPASLGLGAWIAVNIDGHRFILAVVNVTLDPVREALADGIEGATLGAHRLGELWRRLSPFTDPAGAAATGGGGRVAGACGVAAASVVCGIAASAVDPGAGGDLPLSSPSPAQTRKAEATLPRSLGTPVAPLPASEATAPAAARPAGTEGSVRPAGVRSAKRVRVAEDRARTAGVPKATTRQTVNEFGLDTDSPSAPAQAPAPQSPQSPGSSSSSPSPSGATRSAGTPSSSSGAAPASEFGL
jgi:RNA polymerase sigma factor (sigma-70 family)